MGNPLPIYRKRMTHVLGVKQEKRGCSRPQTADTLRADGQIVQFFGFPVQLLLALSVLYYMRLFPRRSCKMKRLRTSDMRVHLPKLSNTSKTGGGVQVMAARGGGLRKLRRLCDARVHDRL